AHIQIIAANGDGPNCAAHSTAQRPPIHSVPPRNTIGSDPASVSKKAARVKVITPGGERQSGKVQAIAQCRPTIAIPASDPIDVKAASVGKLPAGIHVGSAYRYGIDPIIHSRTERGPTAAIPA